MSDKSPPAFPNVGDNSPSNECYDGMTLRDYFAAKAMASIEHSLTLVQIHDRGEAPKDWTAEIAKQAYAQADAMINQRNQS